jgi:hypothetical protein
MIGPSSKSPEVWKGVKERAKEFFATAGMLLFVAYVGLYFVRTDFARHDYRGEKLTFRRFENEAEMRIFTPILKVEERCTGVYGYVPAEPCFPSPE